MTRLSPLAEAVLKDHRNAPNDHFFDLAVFGSMFPSESIERLQAAYDELQDAGLVERSGDFEELFGRVVALYRPTDAGRAVTKVA